MLSKYKGVHLRNNLADVPVSPLENKNPFVLLKEGTIVDLAYTSGATARLAEPQLGYSQFWHAVSFTEHTDPVLEPRFGPARWLNRFQPHQLQQDFKNSIHCQ